MTDRFERGDGDAAGREVREASGTGAPPMQRGSRAASDTGAPRRVDVIGSRVNVLDESAALDLLQQRLEQGAGGYVCFTNVHAAVMGRRDKAFRAITNGSFLSVADGKPVFWVGRIKAGRAMGQVPGPDFMLHAMRRFPARRHFLYGSTPAVLEQLVATLRSRIPGLNVCGALSPPFRRLSDEERESHYRMIREAGADFVWVGLGAPKQEQWMAEAAPHTAPGILLGVGAAFDFHSGNVQRAPARLRRMGLEWLHRLLQEPKRLGKRYLVTNTLFLWYALTDRPGGGG